MNNQTISFLRFLAIVAIVIHHSICVFCGWPPNHTVGCDVPTFALLVSGILKTFGLGVFTFISGYLLFYQVGKRESAREFFVKKAKRILLPCIFWAIIYWAFFRSFMYNFWPSPVNGTHLWYLPMLFLCMVTISTDFFFKHYSSLFIVLTWVAMFLLYRVLPIRTINELFQFLPVFYLGYFCHKFNLDRYIKDHELIGYSLVCCGLSFCLLFCYVQLPYVGHILQLATCSVTSFIASIILIMRRNRLMVVEKMISRNSFAIYLIHKFVINILLVTVPFSSLGFYISFPVIGITSLLVPVVFNYIYVYCLKVIRFR